MQIESQHTSKDSQQGVKTTVEHDETRFKQIEDTNRDNKGMDGCQDPSGSESNGPSRL